jgi:hypothetical protein
MIEFCHSIYYCLRQESSIVVKMMSGNAYSMIVEGNGSGRREKLPKRFLLGDVMKQSLVGEDMPT